MIVAYVTTAALLSLALVIAFEVLRSRAPRKRLKMRPRQPRRQPLLEDRIRGAFEAPRAEYGDIFVNYMVWRREQETRLELFAGDPWHKLNAFTRSIVVRHLWRTLESLSQGSVVIVDYPPQQWSQSIDQQFDDNGVDPWAERKGPGLDGPQFIRE